MQYILVFKRVQVLTLLLLMAYASYSKPTKLTGSGFNAFETVTLRFFYTTKAYPTLSIKADAHGSFTQEIDLLHPVFVFLQNSKVNTCLLLSPGNNLSINGSGTSLTFSGASAVENRMLQTAPFESALFFSQHTHNAQPNTRAGWSKDSIERFVFAAAEKELASQLQIIRSAQLSGIIKEILSTELTYKYQIALVDFATNIPINNQKEYFLQKAAAWVPLPSDFQIESSNTALQSVENHYKTILSNTGKQFRKDSVLAKKEIEALFRAPFPLLKNKSLLFGEGYLIWKLSQRSATRAKQEKILLDQIMAANRLYNVAAAKMLADTLQFLYPQSQYLDLAKSMVAVNETAMQEGYANKSIRIHSEEKLKSFAQITEKHKGKVIYVDIWGTWCGPCIVMIEYMPAIKKMYAGKDVAFVYVAMDEDGKDQTWKDMIRLKNMDGDHYRLNRKEVQWLWEAIGRSKEQSYPTYLLIDKNGKLVNSDAAWPDAPDDIQKQINALL